MKHRFPYQWTLNNTNFTKDKGKVFSCFACGGGSTMGYKLAGFDVIGMNEIDPKMAECYITNHNPKYSFIEDIRVFKDRDDLPEELYHLDILDGSPPCSSFSMAGNREKDWGKEKKFREGQSEQVLDTLFFDFIALAKKLQPKVAIAENVKGILLGDAKEYVKRILAEFDEAGYVVKEFLLNAMRMGIPQKRERVFFVAIRKDLIEHLPINHAILFDDFPILDLVFFEPLVTFGEVYENYDDGQYVIPPSYLEAWKLRQYGDNDLSCTMGREFNRPNSFFSSKYIYKDKVPNTITGGEKNILFDEPRGFNKNELCKIGSFPLDYNFLSNKPAYLIGMSVPPVMMAQIASRIYEQWLTRI